MSCRTGVALAASLLFCGPLMAKESVSTNPPVMLACQATTTWSCSWTEGTRKGSCKISTPRTKAAELAPCACGPHKGQKIGVTIGCE